MKSRRVFQSVCAVLGLWILILIPLSATAQAIPEPPQILFGQIYNPAGGPYSRVTSGTLTWTFAPVGGGVPVVVSAQCTNQYSPYAFLVKVPSESAMAGVSISSNVLALTSPARTYDRSAVQLNGQPIYLKYPTQELFSISSASRGQMQEVDLTMVRSDQDTDGNGLPDGWQSQYFGHLGVNPNAINASGMSNLAAYLAGTNPNDPHGAFRLVGATPGSNGNVTVSWTSVPNHTYTLHRASSLSAGFQVIASGLPAATGQTTTAYLDTPPAGSRGCFYQVSIP